ncbi:MAG: hypothetical protein M9955_04280 [Rhizobiaceae bacterium]|nr:hypothetical protein [Rhizobiaceae bacterium]
MEQLAALIQANEAAAKAIAAAYELGLGGVPNQEGFTVLINNLNATNFGSNNPNIVFNDENIFINVINALVQGNPTAAAAFAAITAGASSLSDKVAAFYNELVPASAQSAEGLAYLTRPDALAFYAQVAAERGVAGPDGAAIVALASMVNVFVKSDLAGIGDSVNDLYAAILDGSAVLPATGDTFTPIETADGTNFDADDGVFGQVTLTVNPDTASGSIFEAPRAFNPGGTDQMNTLNDDDVLTGTGAYNVLNFTYVNDTETGDNDINPTLNNIQEINVNSRLDGDGYLDLQDTNGLQEMNVSGVDDGLFEAYNIQSTNGPAGLNLSVNNSRDEDSHVHFLFTNAAAAGASDTVNLTLNNVDLYDIIVQAYAPGVGIEHHNIASVGAANALDEYYAEDAEDITVTGDQDLTIGYEFEILNNGVVEAYNTGGGLFNVAGSLTKFDASALTGDLDVVLGSEVTAILDGTSGVPVAFEATGGSGDDTFRLAGGANAGTVVEGGAGSNTVVVFSSVTAGAFNDIQHLRVEDEGPSNGTVTVDTALFPDLEDIYLRNETVIGNGPVTNFVLNNLSATVAQAITVAHSTTGDNGINDVIITANLATNTANDTVGVTIVDGVNADPRFNFQLNAAGVENVTFHDNDTESNNVQLTAAAAHTGTLIVDGGRAGDFFNLDSGSVGGGNTRGIYGLNASGAATDGDNIRDGDGDLANVARLMFATIDASDYLGDFIARVGGGSQNIATGSGDDTIVADLLNDSRAGWTIADVWDAGTGFDTLAIDGSFAGVINLGASEWEGLSGVDAIRLVDNDAGSYFLTLTNELVDQTDGGTNIAIINDNDPLNNGTSNTNSAVVIDARTLTAANSFSYDGEENGNGAADRFIFADANINGKSIVDGGDQNTAALNQNVDIVEVRNGAVVTEGDLAGISNVGFLHFNNDLAIAQTLDLQLTNAALDKMDSSQLATVLAPETFTVRANDGTVGSIAAAQLNLDASTVGPEFNLNVFLDSLGGNNTVTLGSAGGGGSDLVVFNATIGVSTVNNFNVTFDTLGVGGPLRALVDDNGNGVLTNVFNPATGSNTTFNLNTAEYGHVANVESNGTYTVANIANAANAATELETEFALTNEAVGSDALFTVVAANNANVVGVWLFQTVTVDNVISANELTFLGTINTIGGTEFSPADIILA